MPQETPKKTAPRVDIKSQELADGSVRWYLWFRPPPENGRATLTIPGATKATDRPIAEAFLETYRKALSKGLYAPKPETADEWYRRFAKSRAGKVSTVDQDVKQWGKHISPIIGSTAMIEVSPDQIEEVRDYLNRQIDVWEEAGSLRGTGLSFSTAANVWSICTLAFKHGRALVPHPRSRGQPLPRPPPRRGRSKRRHWCYPAWFQAAMDHPENDRELKEAVAIGVGLHLRPGEQREVLVRDIDLEAAEVRIHRSYDEVKKAIKGTKTDEGVRTVTIAEWLLPLLKRIVKGRKMTDRISPWIANTSEHDRPELFRAFVLRGGAAPEFVFADTATHEALDFRSLRDTGITWRFLAGEKSEIVQREAGHEHVSTTLGYAKEVANKGSRYGTPALDLSSPSRGRNDRPNRHRNGQIGRPSRVHGVL